MVKTHKPLEVSILEEISGIPTAPFYEELVYRYLNNFFEKFEKNPCISFKRDEYGNMVVHYEGNLNSKNRNLAYIVHTDHPAFHLKTTENGELLANRVGGLNQGIVTPGSHVNLHKITEKGVNSSLGEIVKKTKLGEYVIKPAERGNFSFATLNVERFNIGSDSVIRAPVLDDYAGISITLATFTEIVEKGVPINLYLIFHRAEEAGFAGAYGAILEEDLPRDCIVYSVEASPYIKKENSEIRKIAEMGGGIVIRTGDRCTVDYDTTAINLLKEASVGLKNVKEARMDGGTCEASLYYAKGYRTAGICLPISGHHNDGMLEGINKPVVEGVHLSDLLAGKDLMVSVIERLGSYPNAYSYFEKHRITKEQTKLVESVKFFFRNHTKEMLTSL